MASSTTSCVLVRFGHYRGRSATEREHASFGALSASCSRYGFPSLDHLVVIHTGGYTSVSR